MSRPAIHPGEILAEELVGFGSDADELARQLKVACPKTPGAGPPITSWLLCAPWLAKNCALVPVPTLTCWPYIRACKIA